MKFHLNALCVFAAMSSLYWGLIATLYFSGAWPVMSMAFNFATGNPVWILDAAVHLFLVLVGYTAAADMENEA